MKARTNRMLKSSKERGRFEKPLIQSLERHFKEEGFSVLTHARLNIAWSNVISDIDILAVSDDRVVIIEVKSDHDDFYKGFNQLKKLKGFADNLYIATNRKPESLKSEKWRDESIGLIHVNNQNIEVLRPARKIRSLSKKDTFSQLKRKCLVRLTRLLNVPTHVPKVEIERRLRMKFDEKDLKVIAKRIALCKEDCENDCILEPFLVSVCSGLKPLENQVFL
jgi:Holliday junction resolvase